jgi:hypothetical protein
MRIAWIVKEGMVEHTSTGIYSYMASYRYRAIIPAAELTRSGHETSVITVSPDANSIERIREPLQGVDVAVFSKLFKATPFQPQLVEAAREAGARTVVDACDDFVDLSYVREYQASVEAADGVSTGSAFLAGRIAEMTGRRATVILDPYEGARGTPRWEPGKRLEALWFGNPNSLSGLDQSLPHLRNAGIPMHLVVVTRTAPPVIKWGQLNRSALAPTIDLDLRAWSLPATAQALRECDIVLLPINPKVPDHLPKDLVRINRQIPYYLSKGPNRMVESLWAGRFVVAQALPAYEEFREWAWIGEDPAEGLAWAIAHPAEVVERIAAAQAHIARRYAPSVVASEWGALISGVREGRHAPG